MFSMWYYGCMMVLLLVLTGLMFGSFINALVWRLHENKDWVSDRSECPHCHHKLAAQDLVPVFSWLFLGGKCRYCKKPIPDSPLVELALPGLFVLSYLLWPQPLSGVGLYDLIFWLVFLVGFTALAVWFCRPDIIIAALTNKPPVMARTIMTSITVKPPSREPVKKRRRALRSLTDRPDTEWPPLICLKYSISASALY